MVQRDLGDHQRASESLKKAAHIQSKLLGDHEDTARGYAILGGVQHILEDLKGAASLQWLNEGKKALNVQSKWGSLGLFIRK